MYLVQNSSLRRDELRCLCKAAAEEKRGTEAVREKQEADVGGEFGGASGKRGAAAEVSVNLIVSFTCMVCSTHWRWAKRFQGPGAESKMCPTTSKWPVCSISFAADG